VIIPGLGTLKNWAIIVLTLGGSILFGLWKHQQAARASDYANRVKLGKKAREKADKALIDGLQREKESADEDVKPDDINRFY